MVELRQASAAEILPFIARAGRRAALAGVMDAGAIDAIASDGAAFVVFDGGAPIFGYTLEIEGREIIITAAAGTSKHDLTRAGLQMIEAQARDADGIQFDTVRTGLVRKAQKLGYVVTEKNGTTYTMRKALNEHN